MPLTPALQGYLNDLEGYLGALSVSERAEILMETRSHLVERQAHMGVGEILSRMGPARDLALAYLDEAGIPASGAPRLSTDSHRM